jgi:hypothetical protein
MFIQTLTAETLLLTNRPTYTRYRLLEENISAMSVGRPMLHLLLSGRIMNTSQSQHYEKLQKT